MKRVDEPPGELRRLGVLGEGGQRLGVVAERRRVSAELAALGYTFPPSQANFVWLPLRERTAGFARAAAEAKVLVRPYGDAGARVTIGAPEENDAFLRFARSWVDTDAG